MRGEKSRDMQERAVSAPPQPRCLDPEHWLDVHGDALYRYALQRTGSPDTAEDLVQEALLAAWRNRDTFRGTASEGTWLTGILRHKLVDHLRQQATRQEKAREQSNVDAEAIEDTLFTSKGRWRASPGFWGSDPLAEMEAEAFVTTLSDCLDGLPPTQRACFVLREMDDVAAGDASSSLGVSTNHLYVLVHRARLAVRRCLEARWFRGPAPK